MAKSGEGEVGILRVLEAGLGQPWPSSWSVFLPEPHLCPRGDLPSQPASPLSLTSSHPTLRRTELPQQMPAFSVGLRRPHCALGLIDMCSSSVRITFFIRVLFEPWQTPSSPQFLRTNG